MTLSKQVNGEQPSERRKKSVNSEKHKSKLESLGAGEGGGVVAYVSHMSFVEQIKALARNIQLVSIQLAAHVHTHAASPFRLYGDGSRTANTIRSVWCNSSQQIYCFPLQFRRNWE